MNRFIVILTGFLFAFSASFARAGCPLDHLLIGCNPSGIEGTDDDMQLFFDVTKKYRQSDPDDLEDYTWLNWYYPMSPPGWHISDYHRNVPGFDWNTAQIHELEEDHELWIECLAISDGLEARIEDSSVINAGDEFYFDGHFHMWYRVSPESDLTIPYWITFQVYDKLGNYQSSEPTTIVFMNEPLEGDLTLDGTVEVADLAAFFDYWLAYSDATQYNALGQAAYDLFERADINRDYVVDMADFAKLANNWMKHYND